MPLDQFLKRVLNESINDDDEFYALEIYEDGDECPDDEWDDAMHTQSESMRKVAVVRKGLLTKIARSSRPGFKVAHGEEQAMSFAERRARQRAAERTYVRKKKWQSDKLQAQRQESISKRKDYKIE